MPLPSGNFKSKRLLTYQVNFVEKSPLIHHNPSYHYNERDGATTITEQKKKRKHTELVSHISHLWQNEDSSSFEDDDAEEEEDGEEKERGNLAAAISFGGESFKVELVLQLEIELDLGAVLES